MTSLEIHCPRGVSPIRGKEGQKLSLFIPTYSPLWIYTHGGATILPSYGPDPLQQRRSQGRSKGDKGEILSLLTLFFTQGKASARVTERR